MTTAEAVERVSDDVYVVIAAFNEDRVVGEVVTKVRRVVSRVVVVDDGSRDSTADCARRSGAIVLRHAINRGQGAALQTGITYCLTTDAAIIVTFDADGQHDEDDIPALVAPIIKGSADVVLGSRLLAEDNEVPFGRRILLAAGVAFTRITTGARLTDTHNGLRALSRAAARDGMAHASEIIDQLLQFGLRYERSLRVSATPATNVARASGRAPQFGFSLTT